MPLNISINNLLLLLTLWYIIRVGFYYRNKIQRSEDLTKVKLRVFWISAILIFLIGQLVYVYNINTVYNAILTENGLDMNKTALVISLSVKYKLIWVGLAIFSLVLFFLLKNYRQRVYNKIHETDE